MARDLVGRVAIVGLDQGDVARRLAAEGATVVLVGDDAAAAGALLAEIEAGGGGRAAYFRLPATAATPPEGMPSSGPTGSALDALVELVAGMWPAR